jgi:uncharacterized protein (TIGR00725 family)
MAIRPVVAVVGGGGTLTEETESASCTLGRELARLGAVIVCGGLEGVMEAASRGAREAGGTVIGVLPGLDHADGNPHLTVSIATGMGFGRNTIIAVTCVAMVAVDGSYGTLSEVAQALNHGRHVVALRTWDLPAAGKVDPELFHVVPTAEEAARLAFDLASRRER